MTDAAHRATSEQPEYFDVRELCPKCAMYYFEQPFLVESCASVGIEYGKSTGLILKEFFESFHKKGHKDEIG